MYRMAWDINLEENIVAAAPFGGPIGKRKFISLF